jgi:hypothetical protein
MRYLLMSCTDEEASDALSLEERSAVVAEYMANITHTPSVCALACCVDRGSRPAQVRTTAPRRAVRSHARTVQRSKRFGVPRFEFASDDVPESAARRGQRGGTYRRVGCNRRLKPTDTSRRSLEAERTADARFVSGVRAWRCEWTAGENLFAQDVGVTSVLCELTEDLQAKSPDGTRSSPIDDLVGRQTGEVHPRLLPALPILRLHRLDRVALVQGERVIDGPRDPDLSV